MPEADHLDLSHPTGAALEATADPRSYGDLAAEHLAEAMHAGGQVDADTRPTSVQLRDAQTEIRTLRQRLADAHEALAIEDFDGDACTTLESTIDYALNRYRAVASSEELAADQLKIARGDADRQLRNSRHLGSLLEQIARTLGADPLDLNELPALVDGLRTTRDQLAIQNADHRHTLDRLKQADLDRLKAHLGIRPGQAVGVALVPHVTDPHLIREPAYEAARSVIHQLPGDPRDNARLWAAVEAALDAMGVPAGIDLTTAITDRAGQTQELPPRVDDLGTPLHGEDLGDAPFTGFDSGDTSQPQHWPSSAPGRIK